MAEGRRAAPRRRVETPPRRASVRTFLAVAVGVAIVAAAVVLVMMLRGGNDTTIAPLTFTAADGVTLSQVGSVETYAAANARPRASYQWPAGEDDEAVLQTLTNEDAGSTLSTYAAMPPTPEGKISLTPSGQPTERTVVEDLGDGTPPQDLAATLAAQVPDGCDYSPAVCSVVGIGVLRTSAFPAFVAADSVLLKAVAALEGATILGTTVDHAGREVVGVGVGSDADDATAILQFQPTTGLITGVDVIDTSADSVSRMVVVDPRA